MAVPQGRFELRRPQAGTRGPLRAWDAADEYVLGSIHRPTERGPAALASGPLRVLLVNDTFGALATALANHDTTSIDDSFSALKISAANLDRNEASATLLSTVEPPSRSLETAPDLVIVKIPRTRSLLEHQLHLVRHVASSDTTIIGAGMVKRIHTSTLDLFERIIGPTVTSLAQKKARLIFPTLDPRRTEENPWPAEVELDGKYSVVTHAGVFAGTKLDIGTRVLLENLPEVAPGIDAVDLGCGNGVLGAVLAARTGATVTFVDDSFLAVASARATFERAAPHGLAHFVVDDAGRGLPDASYDLVLTNPPFHQGDVLSDAVAWDMFVQARRILREGGELRVVSNRHLGYQKKLKRLFGNCDLVTDTPKFTVLSARS